MTNKTNKIIVKIAFIIASLSCLLGACNSLDQSVANSNLNLGDTGKNTSCVIYGTACDNH